MEKKYSEVEELCNTMFIRMESPNYIKLHVRRAYIMDIFKDLLPERLGFLKGAMDSEDMPFEISIKMLHQSKILKDLVKNSKELTEETSEGIVNFKRFYKQFSMNFNLDIHEDSTNMKNELAEARQRLPRSTPWRT